MIRLSRDKTINSIMGYRIFDNLINESQIAEDENILYLKSGGEVIARAVVTDEGFVILKGSKIKGDIRPAISESLLKYCKKERESSNIVDGIFIDDHLVSSPSMGAVIILGINTNGRTVWKNKNGVTLKELQETQKWNNLI